MSNPANPQNPYSPPAQQQAAPAGYPQQATQRTPLDRGVMRQVVFGGVIVVAVAIISQILSILGSLMYSFRGDSILSTFWGIFIAVVFAAGAGASALYIAKIANVTSTVDLLKKLAVAVAVGTAALLVLNFIWAVLNGGEYLVQMIISSGLLGSIATGLHYGAFFALGVFIARALPPKQQHAVPAQGHGQAPQGYVQQAPQAPQAPQGYAQQQAPGQPQYPGAGHPPAQQQSPRQPQA